MTTEKIKRMLDACYQAKRIRELLPPLPQGVTPSYIQYLDNIHALEKQGIQVKISDISDVMNLPRGYQNCKGNGNKGISPENFFPG